MPEMKANPSQKPVSGGLDRRSFLKRSAAAAAAGVIGFPMILPSRVKGANERLVLGMVGTGGQGTHHVRGMSRHCSIAAVADAYLPHAERAAKWLHDERRAEGVEVYQNYLALLERDDIDAVVIATPLHQHALNCVHAALAGKDIYCEKPLTNSIAEGRRIVEAVKKHNIVFQTGSQQRSEVTAHVALTHVRNGTLGKVKSVKAHNYRSAQENGFPGEDIPAGLDWDLWCGPAEKPEFNKAIWSNERSVAPSWSGVRPFSGGDMTDWGSHGLDLLQWGLGMDESGPEEVWVEGDPFVPMISTPENPGGRRGGPRSPIVFLKFPGDIIVELDGGHVSGGTFVCEEGQISVTRGGFHSTPVDLRRSPLENPGIEIYRGHEYARTTGHDRDWLNAIKERRDPVAPAEAGHRTATLCHLGNIARWVSGITGETGVKLKWDAVNERFTNSDIANQFLDPAPREGFEFPAI